MDEQQTKQNNNSKPSRRRGGQRGGGAGGGGAGVGDGVLARLAAGEMRLFKDSTPGTRTALQ